METHLEKIEGLERWQAWADAQESIEVTHGDGHMVTLSRWDVHNMLESATEAVFSSPGTGGRTSWATAFCVGPEHRGSAPAEFLVQRPAETGGWIQELLTLATNPAERFYQVGSWIVRLGSPDYYIHVTASTDAGMAAAYRAGGDTYRAMFLGSSQCKDRTEVMMGFLQGKPLLGTPPEMARLVVAMCVSEAARNHRTWGINLMLLDLLWGNAVPGGWSSLIQEGMHPMAKGSTFEHGRTGMKGGRVSRQTWAHETGITMLWLTKYAGVKGGTTNRGGRWWRDPVKGQAFGGTVRRRLTSELVTRFRKVGWGWE
jgi:hypothetical protein